ncbi:MAG TPA: HEPN domain-containing protein [Caldithrix sp.]|nr:HEPN domain-containing protein [Caldithrix sp.]
MVNDRSDIEKTVNHWISTSDQDYKTMIHLYKSKDFHWALFIGHIVIERLLKAKIVEVTKAHAPFIHDLRRLAKLTNINFEDMHLEWFDTITTFNLNARYDSYKQAFYKKCTEEYTSKWIANIKELRKWIKTKL